MTDDGTQSFFERETDHVYTCRECGTDVRVGCRLVPDGHGYKRNSGPIVVCDCLHLSLGKFDPDSLPWEWIVDMDDEVNR